MNREDIIRMARDCGINFHQAGWPELERFFKAAYAAGVAVERKNKSHSLGPGQMELSLQKEHNGELFAYRYRFTANDVTYGPDWLVLEIAKNLAFELEQAIRARGKK